MPLSSAQLHGACVGGWGCKRKQMLEYFRQRLKFVAGATYGQKAPHSARTLLPVFTIQMDRCVMHPRACPAVDTSNTCNSHCCLVLCS
jgi:hypothetical protein